MKWVKGKRGSQVQIGRWFYARGRTPKGLPRRIGDKRVVGFMHACKDGRSVLRGEASWRTISGVYVNAFGGFATVQFRRFG